MPWICRPPARTAARLFAPRLPARIIMRVDAESHAGHGFHHLAHDRLNLMGQGATIGVTQNDPARAGFMRRFHAIQRIGAVGLEAIEEMLAIDHRFLAGCDGGLHAVADALEVLCERTAQSEFHVVIPRTRHETDGLAAGLHKRLQTGIVRSGNARALVIPKAVKVRGWPGAFEKFRIDRVRTGIPPSM